MVFFLQILISFHVIFEKKKKTLPICDLYEGVGKMGRGG